jgi:hypothetical protein
MSSENRYQKSNDEYATPQWLREIFATWYDPCPLNGKWDMLKEEWASTHCGDRIFINPPYSNPLPWVLKAIEEYHKGKIVALLLKHDSSTQWFAKLHEAGAHFLPIMGRLSFDGEKPAPFPSVLVILHPISLVNHQSVSSELSKEKKQP